MVAEEMAELGAPVPATTTEEAGSKCHQKWRNLWRRYKKYKERVKAGEENRDPPKYSSDMDAVMSSEDPDNESSSFSKFQGNSQYKNLIYACCYF